LKEELNKSEEREKQMKEKIDKYEKEKKELNEKIERISKELVKIFFHLISSQIFSLILKFSFCFILGINEKRI